MRMDNLHTIGNLNSAKFILVTLLFLMLLPAVGFSQAEPKVSAEVDTLAIKIGEQIQYNLCHC